MVADERKLDDPAVPQQMVDAAGRVDVLLLNIGIPAPTTRVEEVTDDEWRHVLCGGWVAR